MMLAVGHLQMAEPLAPEATVELLARVRSGDEAALERLLDRCLPALHQWARGRLPTSLRGAQDTTDLVQNAVLATLRRLDSFEARHQGALQAYFRQAVMNQIRDLQRQRRRRPLLAELPENLPDSAASPLELAIGAENVARYDAAIQRLRLEDQQAIIARVELQYSYDELAVVLGTPTPDAARMAVTRAMKRLAEEMRHG